MIWNDHKSIIQSIDISKITSQNIQLSILREDLIHPEISGNKYRKLKYNFLEAEKLGFKKIITFGGAFSNHISATAAAGKEYGFETIGIIRGEELADKIEENATLRFAKNCGMQLHFISREDYRKKEENDFLETLNNKFPNSYVIPEGGTNDLAISGCKEILHENCAEYDFIATAIGTSGTIAGLMESTKPHQHILGFPSLKGDFIQNDIKNLTKKQNFTIFNEYHFGGYGKVSEELINFVNYFKQTNQIQLEPIYTGKMVFGIFELIKNHYFRDYSKILMIHTGGLQGIEGMNQHLKKEKQNYYRMKKLLLVFGFVISIALQAQESRDVSYIRKHAILAVEEMQLYKVPASITLAQGLLETGGGQSKLADQANNHFGIKCKGPEEWPNDMPRIYHDDDARGECFRKYGSVEESYRDHSKFLALRPYYKALFNLNQTDYKAWANGLKKSGYATDPSYASKLISRIEKYNLDQFDQISTEEVYAKLYHLYNNQDDNLLAKNSSKQLKKEERKEERNEIKDLKNEVSLASNKSIDVVSTTDNSQINNRTVTYETRPMNPTLRIKRHKNNIPYIVALAGESIGTIAKTYNKAPSDLASFNEIQMGSKLYDGQIVFFGKKKAKGSETTYKVQNGDDMYTISQRFGVKINSLYKLNKMEPGDQPKIGQRINLKTKVRS